jgi:hypothetical protein
MNRLTTMSLITDKPILNALAESCGESACNECCEDYGEYGCEGCPVQEGVSKLHQYEDLGYEPDELKIILRYVDSIVRDSKPFEADKLHIHCGYLRQFIEHGICFENSK